jgi:cysteine-rich repeat protein
MHAVWSAASIPFVAQLPCGNGVVDPFEECDDGNTLDEDGCSSRCKIDPGYYCFKREDLPFLPRSYCLLMGGATLALALFYIIIVSNNDHACNFVAAP